MKNQIIVAALVLGTFFYQDMNAQASACPDVFATPDTSLCGTGGCVNLNAQVQGTRATTSYNGYAIPYSPYAFTGGNSILLNIDDTWSSVITMPFCFEFFGNTYNQIVIGSNAIVTFDLAQANGYCQWPINAAIPSNQNPMNSIMAPFHDIDPSVTGNPPADINWQVYGTAPCRQFVITWYSVPMFSCTSVLATSQLVLHESTNIIDIYLANKPTCAQWNAGAAIQGIQNATGTTAYVTPGRNFPTQWTATNDGYRFEPNGAANFTFAWFDLAGNQLSTQTTFQVCPPTTTSYVAVVTNTSCAGTIVVNDTVTIGVSPGTVTAQSTGTADICNGGYGSASTTGNGGTAPYTYLWQPGGQTTQTATNLTAGTYIVTITDAAGCAIIDTVVVNNTDPPVDPLITSNAVNGQLIQNAPGDSVNICFFNPAPGSVVSWAWVFDGSQTSSLQTPCFTVNDSGLYCVSLAVQDSFGCLDTATSCVRVLSEAVITFPNVFTPNGDGFNDFFNATSSGVQALRFDIFDRWGVLIQTINLTGGDVTAPTSGWNGRTTAGNNATDGVYYWVATVTDYQNRVKDYSGFVHLLRSQP